ncbi:MAG TPA: sodium:proton exchanger [Polyangiaceae bacterium]|nr:sodium:proton exchanger [Polyangiaceae bacterium]
MSAPSGAPKGVVTRLVQAVSLVTVFGLLYGAARLAPPLREHLGEIAAIGFLLLCGTLLSELLETIGLPHLSGYLLAGVVAGPHVLHLVDHHTVERLSPVNTLALALIAIAGGAELRVSMLKSVARSVAWALLLQCAIGLVVMALAFLAVSRWVPFARDLSIAPLIGVALLWGTLAVSRSPSACLAILSQTRAKGPVATFSLAFIMASDVVVVVLMAVVMTFARPLIAPDGSISFAAFQVVGHEILGSIATGTTLGLALAAYLRLVGKHLLVVLLALGLGLTEFMRYVHIDPLLSFLTAGFVVQNLSAQGEKLLHAVEQVGGIVFVVFFATAGAHLDIPLLQKLWPIALALCVVRGVTTWGTARLSSRVAGDGPLVRRWGWSGLISQAGLTLGLSVVIARSFPDFGEGFRSLVIAAVAINELIGPVLFKLALDRTGESNPEAIVARPSLSPVAVEGHPPD